MLDWNTSQKPIVALAPMADMTDLPFCLLCKEQGAPVIFREMVSSEAIVRMNPKTLKMAEFDERERPLVQQIFGSDPHVLAEAARIIEERFHPDGIDINMGCPVSNIVSNFNGAFLIKEPKRAHAIITEIRNAVSTPVSVKTRLGWSDDTECLEFVRVLANAGTSLITMHARTKEQGYSGAANWKRVGEARTIVPHIPFLVNGDIVSPELAKEALMQSGADGVMIGRGALGNPWIFQQIQDYLKNGTYQKNILMDERIRTIHEHAERQIQHFGLNGLIKLRKHFPWYFKNMSGWKELRAKLVRVTTMEELEKILKEVKQNTNPGASSSSKRRSPGVSSAIQ